LIAAVCQLLTKAGIPPPSGLTCANLVFQTSLQYNGNLGGLTGANQLCNTLAANAKLSGTFKAWLSTSAGSPSTTFTEPLIPYTPVDGTLIAKNWTDLISGTLRSFIDEDENGVVGAGAPWTNTNANGTLANSNNGCSDFTSASQTERGVIGNSAEIQSQWTNYGVKPCNITSQLYCFQQ
jgi:hypothetical protein